MTIDSNFTTSPHLTHANWLAKSEALQEVQAPATLTAADLDEINAAVTDMNAVLRAAGAADELEPAMWQLVTQTESLRQKLIAFDANADSKEVDLFLATFDTLMATLASEAHPEVVAGLGAMNQALSLPAEPAAAKLQALQQAFNANAALREQIFGLDPARCPPAMVDFMLACDATADALVETALGLGLARISEARALPSTPIQDKLMALQEVLTDNRALRDWILAGPAGDQTPRMLEFAEAFQATALELVDAADQALTEARQEFDDFLAALNSTPEPSRSDAQRQLLRLLVQIQAEGAKTALEMSFMEAEMQIADLKAAARETRQAGEHKRNAAFIQAGATIAAGVAQVGMAGRSASLRVGAADYSAQGNAAKHAGNVPVENAGNRMAAKLGGQADVAHAQSQAAGGSIGALGTIGSALYGKMETDATARAQALQASATARDVNRQAWLDLMRSMKEAGQAAINSLGAVGSSEAQTTSAIARNMA